MSEHYTRNTTGVLKYCPTCGKKTMHRVANKRLGTCTETHVVGKSAKQKEEDNKTKPEPSLF